ncbi:MAG TPA: hypothetical protein PKA19_07905 [Bacillota bacterium]|nr:hypothetical protein [Bacillota bacterium]
MKRYYKLLILPAIIVIIAGFFSEFSEQSYEQLAQSLLKERTNVLQNAYYGKVERELAEDYLDKVETYPLLSEDISSLRDSEATEMDRVRSMEFSEIKQESKQFPYVALSVTIRWHMSGPESDYFSDHEYSVILKSTNNGYKLAGFDPK